MAIDEVLYDHVGQIVMTAVLQGIIIGSRDHGNEAIKDFCDEAAKKATSEIVRHLRIAVQQIREEVASSPF